MVYVKKDFRQEVVDDYRKVEGGSRSRSSDGESGREEGRGRGEELWSSTCAWQPCLPYLGIAGERERAWKDKRKCACEENKLTVELAVTGPEAVNGLRSMGERGRED